MWREAINDRSLAYPLLGALLTLWVIAGFWPQYYHPLLTGALLAPRASSWGIHVHAAVFLLWVAGFAVQAIKRC